MASSPKNFFKGSGGRILITAICAVVIWGLMVVFIYSNLTPLVLVVAAICAYFGWLTLNKLQPSMFIWMSWMGWIIYFLIKFFLSVAIGFIIAPFVIGKKIGGSIHDSIRQSMYTFSYMGIMIPKLSVYKKNCLRDKIRSRLPRMGEQSKWSS